MEHNRLRSLARALRRPPVWLLWAAAVGVGFLWSLVILGISMALAETTPMWWVVPPVGIVPLVLLLFLVGRVIRKEAGYSAPPDERLVLDEVAPSSEPRLEGIDVVEQRGRGLIEDLTERELEVLRLLSTGRTNDEIARDLYVAKGTVKAHVSNIMRKLGASNRTEAVARARDLGLLPSTPDHRALPSDGGQASAPK